MAFVERAPEGELARMTSREVVSILKRLRSRYSRLAGYLPLNPEEAQPVQRCAELLCAFANSRDGGIIIAGVDQGFRVRTGFWGDVARGLVRAAADRLSCPVEAALPARGRLGLAVQGRVRAALPGEP